MDVVAVTGDVGDLSVGILLGPAVDVVLVPDRISLGRISQSLHLELLAHGEEDVGLVWTDVHHALVDIYLTMSSMTEDLTPVR